MRRKGIKRIIRNEGLRRGKNKIGIKKIEREKRGGSLEKRLKLRGRNG